MKIIKNLSPNFDPMKKRVIKYIIIHYSGMRSAQESIKRLKSKKKAMTDNQVKRFIMFYERLTKNMAKDHKNYDAVVIIDKEIDSIEIERLKDLFGIEQNIIQGANGILNGKVLRYKNEPVRHKTLDLIGDLALLGVPIKGHVTAARAGHAINVEFVKKLKKQYAAELANL